MMIAKIRPQRSTPPWGTPVSRNDYGNALKNSGTAVLHGRPGTIWVRYEIGAMVRLPGFHTTQVSHDEARRVFWQGPAGLISFLLEPDETRPPNAWLYICNDQTYCLDKLSKEARRDARRAQRFLRLEPMDWTDLLEHGLLPYSDTRARAGLSDWSVEHFRRRFGVFSSMPGHYVIGAWKGSTLVAFVTLIVIDDWAAIEGCFSATDGRELCPNNGLAHYILDYFLVKRRFSTVTYGTSTVQETDLKGLHFYKTRIGFDAKPVHRAFMLHPFLRPFVNSIALWSTKKALRFKPGDRRLLKINGVLNYLLSWPSENRGRLGKNAYLTAHEPRCIERGHGSSRTSGGNSSEETV